jgi:hypothetical protein
LSLHTLWAKKNWNKKHFLCYRIICT